MQLRGILSALALSGLILFGACEREHAAPVTYSPVGPVPSVPQRPGDPARGYRALVNEPYIRCGLPYSAYRRAAEQPTPDRLLPGREGRNAELPYLLTAYTTKNGVDLVVNNCLSCHAGYFNGRLIVGLGTESLDFTEDPSRRAEAAGAYVEGEAAAADLRWDASPLPKEAVGGVTARREGVGLFRHDSPSRGG